MSGAGRGGRLTFLTRQGCHLCHEALDAVRGVIGEFDVSLEILDVDGSPDLARRHGAEVPVLLVDGTKAFKYRVDPDRLRRRLRRWRRDGGSPAEER